MADLEEIAVERRVPQSPVVLCSDLRPVAEVAEATEQDERLEKSQTPLNWSTESEGGAYAILLNCQLTI